MFFKMMFVPQKCCIIFDHKIEPFAHKMRFLKSLLNNFPVKLCRKFYPLNDTFLLLEHFHPLGLTVY